MNHEKRKVKSAVWLCFAAIVISFLTFACSEPLGEETGEESTFSITIGDGGSRAALSWDPSIDTADLVHTITLTNSSGKTVNKEGVKYGQTVLFAVTPGRWNIAVRGYLGGVLKSEGSAAVNLKPGPNGTIPIKMRESGGTMDSGGIPIAEIEITPPVKNEEPDTTAIIESGNFTADPVIWSPNHNPFQGGVAYTATVTLRANSGYTFTASTAVTVNGSADGVTVTERNSSTITLSYTFTETSTKTYTDILIKTQPTKPLAYTHGDTLNLSGLEITLVSDEGNEDFTREQFSDNHISTIPAHGNHLSYSDNNTSVTVNYGHLTKTIGTLTVNKAVINEAAIHVIVPQYGGTPASTITATEQYTGTVVWKDAEGNAPYDNTFDPGTVYTATITLSPTENYTLQGVEANFFTVTGATTATNAANSGVVTAVFPKTHPGSGTQADPFLVFNVATLSRVGKPTTDGDYDNWTLDKHYKQIRNIDLSSVSNWSPIGTYTSATDNAPFTGVYDGGNYTISNLKIDTTADYQGLFCYIGSGAMVKNVGIVDCDIKGGRYVGGVVGGNVGTVQDCYSTGDVSGNYVGGVVGVNSRGTVQDCYATGDVSGTNNVGGVVGRNLGTVQDCYATGDVSGTNYVGGVVGVNYSGTVQDCYATGDVSGTNNVGGVVGRNLGTVQDCYATGDVSGTNYVGGVVGVNFRGTVQDCYATGDVSGTYYVGGVVGQNTNNGTVQDCYSTGDVIGNIINSLSSVVGIGGVVGYYDTNGTVKNCYATGDVTGNITVSSYTVNVGIGGVVGYYSTNGTVKNCYATGDVTGIITVNSNPTGGMGIGGVVGYNGTVEDCYATGDVKGIISGSINYASAAVVGIGGVAGINTNMVKNSYAEGNVFQDSNRRTNTANDGIGGVVGLNGYNNVAGTVQYCYATGDVSGNGQGRNLNVGGVVGRNVGRNTDGTNTGGTVKNCYATGSVSETASTNVAYVGGVVGYSEYYVPENCVALNPNISRVNQSSSYYYVGRIATQFGSTYNGGVFYMDGVNCYGRRDLMYRNSEKIYCLGGKDITSVDWGSASFWTGTTENEGPSFDVDVWDFSGISDGDHLPKLKNMPGGLTAQTPVIKPIE